MPNISTNHATTYTNFVAKINKEMFRFVEKIKRSRETVFYGALHLLVH